VSALFDHLKSRIEAEGPLSLEDYMAEALGHPEHGYYRKQDPLGENGDFTTAPEISQMFGEILGLWSVVCWQQLGEPEKLNLIELGPGRGTLMADALRAIGNIREVSAAVQVHLVETSPALRERQQNALANTDIPVSWHDRFDDVPDGPFVLLANEFLDALPIRQFAGTYGGWCERLVDLNATGDGLKWTSSSSGAASEFEVPPALGHGGEGSIWEVCPAGQAIVGEISEAILSQGGFALFIDYGYAEQTGGDTFQAVKDHDYADPLEAPGESDLTAHVDFEAVGRVAAVNGVRVSGPDGQGAFLKRLGIAQRAEALKAAASDVQKNEIELALTRLTGRDDMGHLFKAIALSHPELPEPGGF